MGRSDDRWRQLHETYATTGIVPVLGAGVSVGSRLPNWLNLLRRVGDACAPGSGRRLVDRLRKEGFSLPAIAGTLRGMCPDEDFAELVRRELYRTYPAELRQIDRSNADRFVAFVERYNPTLSAVAALCAVARGSPPRFERNERVHAIVNFNIDAVLREYVEHRYGRALVRTVERPSKERFADRINVYCMHGFLRFDRKAGLPNSEGADKLVLAEHEYFDFFNSPTGLFNYSFLHLLREYCCLFIGLSMQDDNIRRLLHYSTKERVQAYRDEGERQSRARAKAIRHFAILKTYKSRSLTRAIEDSLIRLGTQVLWISEYDEIPNRLGQLYASNKEDWNAVYTNRSRPRSRA